MKIVITGASGFVGRNLRVYLKSFYTIRSLQIRYRAQQEISVEGDAVIHLAAKAHDLKKCSSPSAYYEANFELTKQIYDSFLASQASVFVFMSTVKAVADKVEGSLMEEAISNPRTHYGIAKRQAEDYIEAKSVPLGKRVYILRPCMIHGSGNKGNLNLLYQLVEKGWLWPLGRFNNSRSFLSMDNLSFVVKNLLDNDSIPSGIYNVADEEPLSSNLLIGLIAKSQGRKIKTLHIPVFLIKVVAMLGDGLGLVLNSERLDKVTENYVVSSTKIRNAMGVPFPLTAKQGILKTCESFKTKK